MNVETFLTISKFGHSPSRRPEIVEIDRESSSMSIVQWEIKGREMVSLPAVFRLGVTHVPFCS